MPTLLSGSADTKDGASIPLPTLETPTQLRRLRLSLSPSVTTMGAPGPSSLWVPRCPQQERGSLYLLCRQETADQKQVS